MLVNLLKSYMMSLTSDRMYNLIHYDPNRIIKDHKQSLRKKGLALFFSKALVFDFLKYFVYFDRLEF